MSNLLQRGATWHAAKLKAHAGEAVVYSRPSTGQSVPLTATFGKTMLSLETSGGGSRVEWTDADAILTAADLILGGVAVEPQRGDRITRTKGATTITYEVRPYESEPCWRWSDADRTLMRVHTKEVAATP